MKKIVTLALALVAAASLLLIGACGKNNNNNASSPSPSGSAGTAPPASGGGTHDVTVSAVNWKFEPAEIKVKAGDTIKLTLKNEQGAHGLEISDYDVNLKNNETKEIKFDKAGSYEFHCSVQCGQGHDAMTGTIVVE